MHTTTIGWDISKKTSNFAAMDTMGNINNEIKMNNVPEELVSWIRSISGPKELTLEATRNWPLFYELMKDEVDQIHLAHPKKTRVIAEAEIKNDRLDAAILARLTRARFLPEAYIAPDPIRQLRSLLRFRCKLVWKRTSVKNEIHVLIDRNLFPCQINFKGKSFFSKKGLLYLRQLTLKASERFLLDQLLAQLDELNNHMTEVEALIAAQPLPHLADSNWLKTVPGMGGKVAHLIVLAEIGSIQRFPSEDALIHYAGLIPRERSSGEKRFRGGLIRERNTFLRQALLESVTAAIRRDKGLRIYYEQLKKRAGASAARVATARKLLRCIYHVLKEQRAYRPMPVSAKATSTSIAA